MERWEGVEVGNTAPQPPSGSTPVTGRAACFVCLKITVLVMSYHPVDWGESLIDTHLEVSIPGLHYRVHNIIATTVLPYILLQKCFSLQSVIVPFYYYWLLVPVATMYLSRSKAGIIHTSSHLHTGSSPQSSFCPEPVGH